MNAELPKNETKRLEELPPISKKMISTSGLQLLLDWHDTQMMPWIKNNSSWQQIGVFSRAKKRERIGSP